MKKIFLFLLISVLFVSFSSVCFAAPNDNPVQAAELKEVPNEDLAAAAAKDKQSAAKTQDITEEKVPKALPKTGGIPSEAFYIVGGLLIVSALAISMKKVKPASK